MKHIFIFDRLVIFFTRDNFRWVGWSLNYDYYNIIGTITLFTIEIGFEYVRKESNMDIKKTSYGWDIFKN